MKKRIHLINPEIEVEIKECFFLSENCSEFDFSSFDYVVDAIDTISGKIALITKAKEENVKIISAMGAGNKMDPSKLMVTDIYKTEIDPLAKLMRHELKKRNISSLKVVYSSEPPLKVNQKIKNEHGKVAPGSMIFVPASMGLLMASEIVKDLIK